MNNKGFAVTTVIYGLAVLGMMIMIVLMSVLSSTRSNVSSEAKKVERDLIALSKANTIYTYQDNLQEYLVPSGEAGWYRVELFGASYETSSGVRYGAYTTGIIYLKAKSRLIIDLGKANTDKTNSMISVDAGTIMRALGATTSRVGGTLRPYSNASIGGQFETIYYKDLTTTNIIGAYDGTFSDSGVGSLIVGYPTSISGNLNGYYFVDGLMVPNCHYGNGKAIIQQLAIDESSTLTSPPPHNRIPGRNPKYNKIKRIRVEGKKIDKIYVSSDGNIKVKDCSVTSNYCNIDFSPVINIDDIAIYLDNDNDDTNINGQYYKDIGGTSSKIVVKAYTNSTDYKEIYNSSNESAISTVTPTGIKLSAYQPDFIPDDGINKFILNGVFYLFPVTSESKVITARTKDEAETGSLMLQNLEGSSLQKWAIDLVNTPGTTYYPNITNTSGLNEYRIYELTRFKAMSIYNDENRRGNYVNAAQTFNALSMNKPQIWNIVSLKDGTIGIKSSINSVNFIDGNLKKSGYLVGVTNNFIPAEGRPEPGQIVIGTAVNPDVAENKALMPTAVERFRPYSLNFLKF